MKKNSRKSKSTKKGGVQPPRKALYLAPPPFVSTPVKYGRVRGLTSSALATAGFTLQQIVSYCAGIIPIAAVNSTPKHLAASFKFKRILVWGPVATAGTPVTVELRFPGTASSDGTTMPQVTQTDSSVSFDRPAFAMLKPKKESFQGQWFTPTTVGFNLFELTCPSGSIVDIEFDYVLNEDGNPYNAAALTGGATLVVGAVYHLILPGALTCVNLNTAS